MITKDEFIDKILKIRRTGQYHNLSYKFKKEGDNSFIAIIEAERKKPIIINNIKIEGNRKISTKDIMRLFTVESGDQLNVKAFNNEINKVYHTGYFEYVHYDLIPIDDTHSNLIINIKETKNKKVKFGIIWDNHYKLIGKIKLDIFNKPLRKFRLQNELTFSGFKQNNLSLYYLTMSDKKINIIPFIEQINKIQTFGIPTYTWNADSNPTYIESTTIGYTKHDLNSAAYGIIFSMMQYGSITLKSNQSKNIFDSEIYNIDYSQIILDIDQLDNLLNPRSGYAVNIDYRTSSDIGKSFDYLNIKSEYFKTFKHNHTFRVFGLHKESSNNTPLNLITTYGGYNWAIGYDEFELSSHDLSLLGFEYQFHYKNSTTLRFIINHLEKYTNLLFDGPEIDKPINYGFGIKVRSIFGPINFTWGRGYDTIMNQSSKRVNIFYFNFGVKI